MTVGEVISVGRNQMDLAQPDMIYQTIREIKPDFIVNPAAYIAVDHTRRNTINSDGY
jgi:dTDP-4-dehydrorhamnose reductase